MKYKLIAILLLSSLLSLNVFAQQNKHTLSGQITDAGTGEDLISVTIFEPSSGQGTVTNVYGFYSLTLPEGNYEISISYVGYAEQILKIDLTKDIRQDIELAADTKTLGEVVVSAEKEKEVRNVESTSMGVVEVKIESIKKMPALLGEVDIIKAIQL
ncbi:MAG: carboxypeptidase-like regulatory domain-containing protein, partial [Saprospiraceae bacterium]